MKYIITSLFCFFSALVIAQTEPTVDVKADITKIKIGEQLTFSIEAPLNEKQTVFPKMELDGLEVAEEFPVDTIKNKLIKKYLITGFDSGAFYIKKQEVFINAKSYFTDSLLVNVTSIAVDTIKLAPHYKTKGLETEDYTIAEIWYYGKNYLFILLGIAVFIIGLYFLFRTKTKKTIIVAPKIPPYITANKELKDLEVKELWQNNKVKQYYSELTDIVRKYIGDELLIHALETTTDETMELLKSENKRQNLNLDKESLEKLKTLLSQADFVKFAKQKPLESDIKGHESDAKNIIETIHQIVESKKTKEKDEVQ